MRIDYHSHILPNMDDGAKNVEMSMEMLALLKEQGVQRVIATPHFYLHRQKTVTGFLEKRQAALDSLQPAPLEIITGAEVAIERGICEQEGIEKLAITGTNLILLEFPYIPYAEWMLEEIHNLTCEYKLRPVIAHVHRCLAYCSKSEMERILAMKAVFQVNLEALRSFREKHFVRQLIKDGLPLVFGSDCHNMTSRKPNFDLLTKKIKPETIDASDRIFEQYTL